MSEVNKQPQQALIDAIVRETAHAQALFVVPDPIEKLAWTRSEPDYQRAEISARAAFHRLWAQTQAALAGHNSSAPAVDVFLFKIRSQMITIADTSELHEVISRALAVGRTSIFEEIADAQKAAKKRTKVMYGPAEVSGTGFSDFNFFRGIIVWNWVRSAFWLMRDDVIASVLTTLGWKPLGCNRQTINRAVKELSLYRRTPSAIVKIGAGGKFIFAKSFKREIS